MLAVDRGGLKFSADAEAIDLVFGQRGEVGVPAEFDFSGVGFGAAGDEIEERGWEYNPFKGARKPLKSDLGYFYESDEDLQKSEAKIQDIKATIETLESIMTNITWRHQNIRNIIEWERMTTHT